MIFNQLGILLGSYIKTQTHKRLIFNFMISAQYSWLTSKWILSDLADFDHIQLFLEPGQHGVVVASGALGDCAPFLGVWVVTAH